MQKNLAKFSWTFEFGAVQKCVNFGSFLQKTHKCKYCRSRRELSNEHLLAKFGVDTAENAPSQSLPKLGKS